MQVRQGYFRDYIGTRHLPASVLAHERISPVSVAILPVEVDRPGGRIKALRFFRRAGYSLDFAGYFSGLGGLMEPQSDGLDPQVTAIREVGEECGLTITGDDLTYLGTASIGPTHAISYCYLLEVTQQMMQQGFTFSDGEMTHSIAPTGHGASASMEADARGCMGQRILPAGHRPAWPPILSRQTLAAFCTATCQNLAAVNGAHALTETVATFANQDRWLVSTLHGQSPKIFEMSIGGLR